MLMSVLMCPCTPTPHTHTQTYTHSHTHIHTHTHKLPPPLPLPSHRADVTHLVLARHVKRFYLHDPSLTSRLARHDSSSTRQLRRIRMPAAYSTRWSLDTATYQSALCNITHTFPAGKLLSSFYRSSSDHVH